MKTSSMIKLRKVPRHKAIVEDVVTYLKAGELKPGDYLRSYKELMAAYKVSQAPVSRALRELEAMGLIERQRRSFCRVSMDAYSRLERAASQPAGATQAEDTHARIRRLVNYNPFSARHTIRLFLTDGYPEHLAAWHEVLSEFSKAHPKVSIQIDSAGKSASPEIAARSDLVQAVPWFVEHLRDYGFEPAEPCADLAPGPSNLVPTAARFAAADTLRVGVIFELMPVLISLNETALEKSKTALQVSNLPALLLSIADAINTPGRVFGAHLGTLFGLLFHHGAFFETSEGTLAYNERAARELVENYLRLAAAPRGLWLGNDARLLAGGVLAYYGGLYLSIALRRQRRFRWRMMPVPTSNEGRPMLQPIVLAIRSRSLSRTLCEELVRHLCSLPSQIRFGRTGGCLPVLSDALQDKRVNSALPVPAHEAEQLVSTGSTTWNTTRDNCWLEHEVDEIGAAAAEGAASMTARMVMEKISEAVRTYRSMPKTAKSAD